MSEPCVTWGNDGFAHTDGWAFVHSFSPFSGEYLNSDYIWISSGTGLPCSSSIKELPKSDPDKAIVMQEGSWVLVDDFRGKSAYSKEDRRLVVISELGPIPETLTFLAPQSSFDYWSDSTSCWIKDEDKERSLLLEQAQDIRSSLMHEASLEIATLVDSLDPSIVTNPDEMDKVRLSSWRSYRVELSKVDQQPEYPFYIHWPTKPI